ncbi:hypothetical protein FJZ41_03160 [Candidatus Shapirobacteria bacterium]|nr:hypothetical protein [Candidatus Shapirobacteria bacterium]
MKTTRLPAFLHRYFWDIDAKKLNPQKKPQYVIQRILEMGDVKAVRWVRKNFSQRQIIATLKQRRGFSPKTASFWASFLNISKQKVKCLQKPYLQQHKLHWPY